MVYHMICNKSNTTGATSGAVTAGTPAFTSCFNGVRVTRSLVFCVVFLRSWLELLSFFIGHCIVCCFWLPFWYLQTFLNTQSGGSLDEYNAVFLEMGYYTCIACWWGKYEHVFPQEYDIPWGQRPRGIWYSWVNKFSYFLNQHAINVLLYRMKPRKHKTHTCKILLANRFQVHWNVVSDI